MIILDTNVVSEFLRPAPEQRIVDWMAARRTAGLATTSLTTAEIRCGIARLPDGRKDRLRSLSDRMFLTFTGQVLPFDEAAADAYGEVVAAREQRGRPIGPFDAQIAAICRSRNADLATRDVGGFADTGIRVIDPWQEEG